MTNMSNIRRRVTRRINEIPVAILEQILEDVALIRGRLKTPGPEKKIVCRLLTGGYWSQTMEYMVFQKIGEKIRKINLDK